jgi:alpha-L-fucosidase 2
MAALRWICIFSAFATPGLAASIPSPSSGNNPSRIWATAPASSFSAAHLIGNGRIGAAIPGSAQSEVIHVNEDSFWSGDELHRVNPDAKAYMPELQSLIRAGDNADIVQAGNLASWAYAGTPVSTRHYDFLGDIELNMNHSATVQNYQRFLDVNESVAGVYYTVGGVTYLREHIASNPDDIIAIRIASDTPGAVGFTLHLRRGSSLNRWEDYSQKVGNDTIVIGGGSGGKGAIGFSAGARVLTSGGTVQTIGDTILVNGADEAWIYWTAWTDYRTADPKAAVLSDLSKVKPYPDVRSAHIADYQGFAGRVSLDFGKSSAAQLANTTSQRISATSKTFDPQLATLYFQFGRYLFISTSRNGTLPPNLQGIWSADMDPQWGSKYTININLEMNYWPSLVTNLGDSDLQSPLWDLILRLHQNGLNVSQQMYGVKGAVAHHNTDIWGDAAPQDNYISSTFWNGGLAWLATHIWEYYLFTGDAAVLRANYQIFADVATYYVNFVTPYKGWLVNSPSLSCENEYYPPNSTVPAAISAGVTLDNSLIKAIFAVVLESQSILGISDNALAQSIRTTQARLPPFQISSFGGIQEWIEDYREQDPGHRHFSHLWGFYPGAEITASNDTLFQAAQTSLYRRLSNGGGSTGWSRAWAVNLAARSFNGSSVGMNYQTLLSGYTYGDSLLDTGYVILLACHETLL